MDEKKKKVSVIVYDRFADDVIAIAKTVNHTPNEFVNRCIEDCLRQINQPSTPPHPIPIVRIGRLMLRRDLSRGDRMLQDFLAANIDGWAKYQEDWRGFVLEEANLVKGDLTPPILVQIKKRADQRAKAAAAEREASAKTHSRRKSRDR